MINVVYVDCIESRNNVGLGQDVLFVKMSCVGRCTFNNSRRNVPKFSCFLKSGDLELPLFVIVLTQFHNV